MVFFGLGNPGAQYVATRHNLGFMMLDELAGRFRKRFQVRGAYAEARFDFAGTACTLVKPLTFMNLSGDVVRRYREANPGDWLVVCDDLALPFGRIRIREQGSDGGHNGLVSIIERTGTSDFPRVRVGIGEPPPGIDGADYVLSEFTPEEQPHLAAVVNGTADALVLILQRGVTAAMNEFNGRWLANEPAAPEPGT